MEIKFGIQNFKRYTNFYPSFFSRKKIGNQILYIYQKKVIKHCIHQKKRRSYQTYIVLYLYVA